MVSKYIEAIISTKEFKDNVKELFKNLIGKKVLIYGANENFVELNKKYSFTEVMDVVAIADKIFEESSVEEFLGVKAISPDRLLDEKFDIILVTNVCSANVCEHLTLNLGIDKNKIALLFNETISQEYDNIEYIYKHNFYETYPKLVKKLKGKTVMLYGAGLFLEVINKYFDLKMLNVVGIADRKYENENYKKENPLFIGYNTYSPSEIKEVSPDYVLVGTKFYTSLIESLYYDTLKGTGIKIKPLMHKSFTTLFKEIWG